MNTTSYNTRAAAKADARPKRVTTVPKKIVDAGARAARAVRRKRKAVATVHPDPDSDVQQTTPPKKKLKKNAYFHRRRFRGRRRYAAAVGATHAGA